MLLDPRRLHPSLSTRPASAERGASGVLSRGGWYQPYTGKEAIQAFTLMYVDHIQDTGLLTQAGKSFVEKHLDIHPSPDGYFEMYDFVTP